MAKLDKTQQQYAVRRIDELATKAVNKIKYTKKIMSNEELKALLTKKGFTVGERFNLNGYIEVTKTEIQLAAEEKAKATAEKKVKEIHDAAQVAKDEVMLGDSAEVTAILADLAKKLGV
jgi:arsenate reductase-like glutaredoxin family protein